ncbi:MAG: hypothetical protein K9M13_01340, partial [Simkaniaceae bacterium]|nr:hypothetical protein [Simkaniaceae bacterium]
MIKFENQRAFEKHLHSLRSVETVFVVLAQDDKERQDLAFKIKSVVLEKAPHFGVSCFTCIRDSIATILEAYQSMSLFANHQIIEICDIHLLPDRDFTLLKNQIQKSCHDTVTLLLGKKNIPSLKGMSNEVILLDLLNEKPWDHKKRVAQLLVEYIKKTDKNIEPQALDQLIEFIGIDYAALLQQ